MRAKNAMALIAGVTLLGLAACAGEPGAEDEMAMPADTGMDMEPATPADAGDQQAATPDSLPEGVTAEMIAQGGAVFRDQGLCFTCHGQDATGGPLAPDLTDTEWLNVTEGTYEEITQVVRTGVPQPREHAAPMPPMGGASLTDEQVQAVAAYVWSLSHAD